jgi:drug/metabolite transporter (DMT)-like permease
VLLVTAMAFFSVSDALAKYLSASLSPFALAWFRYLMLLGTVVPLAVMRPRTWRTAKPLLQVARAVSLVASALLFMWGLKILPVAEATAMVFASPLFVTLLATVLLREFVPWPRWIPVTLGFVGVLIVVRPGFSGYGGAELFPILSSVAWAVSIVVTRQLSKADSSATTMLYAGVLGTAGLTLVLPPLDMAVVTAKAHWLVVMGVFWCTGQWLTIAAYRVATAAEIAPFAYSQLMWATLLGLVVFHHVPDFVSLLGMAVIVASGLLAAWQTRMARAPASD